MMKKILLTAVSAVSFSVPASSWACATCGCSLSSDSAAGYSAGYSASPGWVFSMLYNYIDQSQLRTGSHGVSPAQVALINNNGGSQEVERRTTNNYFNFGATYSPNMDWHFNLQVPYIDRSHSTYSQAQTSQLNSSQISSASIDQIGDARLIATYQGLLPNYSLGVQLGVKVPTGAYGGQNTATQAVVGHPTFFSSGPALGTSLDTSLQAGTGSTDMIFGAFYHQAVSQDFDAFINGQFQVAVLQNLDSANANYRPGNIGNLSFGLRYEENPVWQPQLQVNISHKSADQGALADALDTAGTVVYISPGLSVRVVEDVYVFGVVQVPVMSWLQGYQLFPRWTGSMGISYAF